VQNERTTKGYVAGEKRRPRSEWVIKEDTHEALITLDEAKGLLADLERRKGKRNYRTPALYLLSGLVFTPDGEPWHGDRDGKQRLSTTGARRAAYARTPLGGRC
jgi:hypothetical protein